MSLEPVVDVPRQDVLQVLALGEELAASQGRDGIRVGQVQLKVDDVALLEGLLGVLSDEVPDACVGDVDRAVEIRGRVPLDGPQEGVQLGLLEGQEENKHDVFSLNSPVGSASKKASNASCFQISL